MSDESNTGVNEAASTDAPKANLNIPNPDKFHNAVDLKFGFRTIKDEKTGTESKRTSVEVKLPVLNFEGIVSVLQAYAQSQEALKQIPELKEGEAYTPEQQAVVDIAAGAKKEYDLLTGAVQGVYESAIKDYLGDNPSVTSENFNYGLFTWTALANQPESERKGRGIAKEVWDDFIKSYVNIMPSLTGKTKENIEKQAAIIAQKFNPLKNHEDKEKILPKFEQALTVYLNGAPDAETFQGCIEFLQDKIKRILTADKNANLAENLGFE